MNYIDLEANVQPALDALDKLEARQEQLGASAEKMGEAGASASQQQEAAATAAFDRMDAAQAKAISGNNEWRGSLNESAQSAMAMYERTNRVTTALGQEAEAARIAAKEAETRARWAREEAAAKEKQSKVFAEGASKSASADAELTEREKALMMIHKQTLEAAQALETERKRLNMSTTDYANSVRVLENAEKAEERAASHAKNAWGLKTGALNEAGSVTSKVTGFIEDNHHAVHKMSEIVGKATGSHFEFGSLLRGELSPALLGVGAAVLVVGKAYEMWEEREKQLDEALKRADETVIEQGRALEGLREAHVKLTPEENATIQRAERARALKMADQWEEQAKALEHLDTKQKIVNATTGEYAPILAITFGPIVAAIGLWAKLTGKAEEYNDQMERLKASQRDVFGVHEKQLEARKRLEEDLHRNELAAMSERERAKAQHEERMAQIERDAHRTHTDPAAYLAAEDARYKAQEAKAAEAGHKRGEKEFKAWRKWAEQESRERERQYQSQASEAQTLAMMQAKASGNQLAVIRQQYRGEEEALFQKLRKQEITNQQYEQHLALLRRQRVIDEDRARTESANKDLRAHVQEENRQKHQLQQWTRLTKRGADDRYRIALDEIHKEQALYAGNAEYMARLKQAEVDLERQAQQAKVSANWEAASAISGSMQQMFGRSKALAYGSTVVHGISAAIKAFDNGGGYPTGLAPMAASILLSAGQLAKISGTNVGQAHQGMDEVRRSGSWNLEGGEMVIDKFAGSAGRRLVEMADAHYRTQTRGGSRSQGGGGTTVIVKGGVIDQRNLENGIKRATQRAGRYGHT